MQIDTTITREHYALPEAMIVRTLDYCKLDPAVIDTLALPVQVVIEYASGDVLFYDVE